MNSFLRPCYFLITSCALLVGCLALPTPGNSQNIEFKQATTTPSLDGTLKGWESAKPMKFTLDTNSVETRCMFDSGNLYLWMHLRKDYPIEPTEVFEPVRVFTHENMRDEISFYFQGNPSAGNSKENGRAGDCRIVFVVTKQDDKPVPFALGMFQVWTKGKGESVQYWSPVRTSDFQHVVPLTNATMGLKIDDDKNGFTIAAKIPAKLLDLKTSLQAGLRTRAAFSATLGGITKFWSSGNKEFTNTCDEPSEAMIYPSAWGNAVFVPSSQVSGQPKPQAPANTAPNAGQPAPKPVSVK